MKLIICPGFHNSELTANFLHSLSYGYGNHVLNLDINNICYCFPTDNYPSYSSWHLYRWLVKLPNIVDEELVLIAFSAGVVAAIGAALALSWQGAKIKSLIALDGWGVPLAGKFPIYRLSHDYFTHWSSALIGAGKEGFYAYPPVDHLQLWFAPESCCGWICRDQFNSDNQLETIRIASTAREYLLEIIAK